VKDRFIGEYFVNDVQREIFEGLRTGQSVSEVVTICDAKARTPLRTY